MNVQSKTIEEQLTGGEELKRLNNKRRKKYIEMKISPNLVSAYLEEGWEFDRELKKQTKIKKLKPYSEIFENEIWSLFYNMGFKKLNTDSNFTISYGKGPHGKELTKQIDVFACDDETALVIECKATEKLDKKHDFKKDIESIHGYMNGVRKSILSEMKGVKVKFIFATRNYLLNEQDKKRLEEFDIFYLDDDKYDYYVELSNHLGNAARYQLLGQLFENTKIKNLDIVVPAISAKLGKHQCYMFCIEPEILLKLGYVLHRSDSNNDAMPTYQRIIKRGRLKAIQEYIDNGGYFPNSIIVSIGNTKKRRKKLKFDLSSQEQSNSISKIGLLHLPNTYKSIYIIDGQHRLYGYANSKYSETNTIPVVAFENLDQQEQTKMFMDINENQKSVPKNLRNTLEEDIKSESNDPKMRRDAICLKVARVLGESRSSCLYRRIIVGENKKSPERNITLESISKAIEQGNFLNHYKKGIKSSNGLLDYGDNNSDMTFDKVYQYIEQSLSLLKDNLGEDIWILGDTETSSFIRNPIISGYIRCLNSILEYLSNRINVLNSSNTQLLEATSPFIKIIADFWTNLSQDEKVDLNSNYGHMAPIKFQRTIEREINRKFPSFEPEGLKKFWDDRNLDNVIKGTAMLNDLLELLKKEFKTKLDNYYASEDAFEEWIPKKMYLELKMKVEKINYNKKRSDYIDIWDLLTFSDLKAILLNKNHWTEVFKKKYAYPSDTRGDKNVKTEWMDDLMQIQKTIKTKNSITVENYEYLLGINNWLKSV